MLMLLKTISKWANDDKDDVQTLGNISNGIANDHLWSLITPTLDRQQFQADFNKICYLACSRGDK